MKKTGRNLNDKHQGNDPINMAYSLDGTVKGMFKVIIANFRGNP
jgi:hypothetical protein